MEIVSCQKWAWEKSSTYQLKKNEKMFFFIREEFGMWNKDTSTVWNSDCLKKKSKYKLYLKQWSSIMGDFVSSPQHPEFIC